MSLNPTQDVAVVVPAYNRPRIVLDALESIRRQTRPPAELVVVDDGSTDSTAPSIEAWLADARLPFDARLVRQHNGGPSAARNTGIAAARPTTLLAFLDSDDLWPADYLERMVVPFGPGQPPVVAATCDLLRVDLEHDTREYLSAAPLAGRITRELLFGYSPNPSSTVVRRDAVNAVGGFDRRYRGMEDLELFLRLSVRGLWAHVAGEPVTYRRGLPSVGGGAEHLSTRMRSVHQRMRHLRMVERFMGSGAGGAVIAGPLRKWKMAELWHEVGKVFQHQGRLGGSIACYRRAVRAQPLYHRSWTRLARTAIEMRAAGGPR